MATGDLVRAVDETGTADLEAARTTWREIAGRYAKLGFTIRRPVALVIEDMPIMGATQPTKDGFRLHVAAHAARSGMLDGLMAHEAGHMVRMEAGHPSHRQEVHGRVFDAVAVNVPAKEREAFGEVAGEAINHVEDIYADDFSIQVIGRDRDLGPFFADWVRNSARRGPTRWATVGNGVTVAFALGNMARHGVRDEDTRRRADAFAQSADLPSLPKLAAAFRDLPKTDETGPVESAIRDILAAIAAEGVR